MSFTRTQQQEAYKKLSPEAQNFIMSNETTELIADYLKQAKLSEEQSDNADSEILYAFFGLQPLSDAIANIAKLSNKKIEDLAELKTDLETTIFNKLENHENDNVTPYTGSIDDGSIQKQIDQLPEQTKKIVLGQEWRKRMKEIVEKYSLTTDQAIKIEREVLFVIIKMKPESNLATNIETELKVSRILATQLADEINTRIFQYIAKMVGESKQEVRSTNNEKEGGIPTSVSTRDSNVVIRNSTPIASPAKIPESKLLSEIEDMADKTDGEVHMRPEIIQKSAPAEMRKGEPPANLPIGEVDSQQSVVNSGIRNKESNLKPAPSIFESKIMAPRPAPVETKLNPIVTPVKPPINESGPAKTNNPIKKTYVADPYREPIE